jgi:hypothetical protein|tara:strand:- start:7538 stop:7678 length:141 start_codon:yes stop_codon:yes gene_type:complete
VAFAFLVPGRFEPTQNDGIRTRVDQVLGFEEAHLHADVNNVPGYDN